MARTAMFRGFLGRMGLSAVQQANTWSVITIEKMLEELGIKRYEFDYEPKVVRLSDHEDLMRILRHSTPSSVSSEYDLIVSRFEDNLKLQLGSWQFEAKA